MFTIRKSFNCDSAHKLIGLAEGHKCSTLHGHSYLITVELKSKYLNSVGMVRDYHELDSIKNYIDIVMDHNDLNVVFDFNPTAENMAKHIFDMFKYKFPELFAVEVSETAKTNARYEKS